jgi:hypothetical protein
MKNALLKTHRKRRQLAVERFSHPNVTEEAVEDLNSNRLHSQFRFMNRTGFLALTLILKHEQIQSVPKLSSIIVP